MKEQKNVFVPQYFKHALQHARVYLFIVLLVVVGTPLIINAVRGNPLIMGPESYYHLSFFQGNSLQWYHSPWAFFLSSVPSSGLFLIPLFLAIACFFLFFKLVKRYALPEPFSSFFLLFVLLSPAFIFTFSTLSAYSLVLFLLLLGFVLSSERNTWKYLAIFPFMLATSVDLASSCILLALFLLYFYVKRQQKIFSLVVLATLILMIVLQGLFLNQPFVLGPFEDQRPAADFISDLGGASGISFSLFLLALIGIPFTLRKKKFMFGYVFLPLLVPIYLYNTHTIFYLSLLLALFAAASFQEIAESRWILETLKRFTILLVVLTLFFSTITYLERVTAVGPTAQDAHVLGWISQHKNREGRVFSDPGESYYIKYFARREPFYTLPGDESTTKKTGEEIFNSTYILTTFPLLEQHHISIIYITPPMRQNLPTDRGLLFVLKNERFKMIYSSEGYELWVFREEVDLERT